MLQQSLQVSTMKDIQVKAFGFTHELKLLPLVTTGWPWP